MLLQNRLVLWIRLVDPIGYLDKQKMSVLFTYQFQYHSKTHKNGLDKSRIGVLLFSPKIVKIGSEMSAVDHSKSRVPVSFWAYLGLRQCKKIKMYYFLSVCVFTSNLNRLDWIGLDWIGLDWIGLDWIGL